jgi:hypothetical protein
MKNAMQAGFDGLVLYKAENSQLKSKSLFNGSLTFAPHLLSNLGLESEFLPMISFNSIINPVWTGIPAVLVSNEDGLSLKNYVEAEEPRRRSRKLLF